MKTAKKSQKAKVIFKGAPGYGGRVEVVGIGIFKRPTDEDDGVTEIDPKIAEKLVTLIKTGTVPGVWIVNDQEVKKEDTEKEG